MLRLFFLCFKGWGWAGETSSEAYQVGSKAFGLAEHAMTYSMIHGACIPQDATTSAFSGSNSGTLYCRWHRFRVNPIHGAFSVLVTPAYFRKASIVFGPWHLRFYCTVLSARVLIVQYVFFVLQPGYVSKVIICFRFKYYLAERFMLIVERKKVIISCCIIIIETFGNTHNNNNLHNRVYLMNSILFFFKARNTCLFSIASFACGS